VRGYMRHRAGVVPYCRRDAPAERGGASFDIAAAQALVFSALRRRKHNLCGHIDGLCSLFCVLARRAGGDHGCSACATNSSLPNRRYASMRAAPHLQEAKANSELTTSPPRLTCTIDKLHLIRVNPSSKP